MALRPRHRAQAALSLAALLAGCASSPPPPDWQVNAHGAMERATQAWLSGDTRVAAAELARARAEVARTGQPALLARVELLHCAARVASLDFSPCTGYEALAQDAAPPEQAYARHLAGAAAPADVPLLPEAQRPVAAATTPVALDGIADPLARLVAAGVLMRRGLADAATAEQAIATASAQGWRRPLLAWLMVARQQAEQAGARAQAQRLQRRIDLVAPPR